MRKWALAIFAIAAVSSLSAQKMGYLNSVALLGAMPEIAQADTVVMFLRDSLYQEGQGKAKLLQDKYMVYMQQMQEGTLPPKEAQKQEAEIRKGQEELQAYEQEISSWLAQQREVLYGPLLDRLQNAIDEVGKENSFQFIFDISTMNIIVFAEESVDVGPLIRAKLGME
jgi:outer membrane protein